MYLAGSPSGDGEEAEEETESGVGWCVGSGVGWYVDLPHHHHHHHHTAQITPQVTTGGADPSPYGRSSISVVPPRLRCSGRLRAGRYGEKWRRSRLFDWLNCVAQGFLIGKIMSTSTSIFEVFLVFPTFRKTN